MPGSASGLQDSSAAGEVEGQAAALGQTERGLLEAEMEITSGPRRTRDRRGCRHHRAGAPHLIRGPARDPTESLKEAPCPRRVLSARLPRSETMQVNREIRPTRALLEGTLGAKIKDVGPAANRPLD